MIHSIILGMGFSFGKAMSEFLQTLVFFGICFFGLFIMYLWGRFRK